MNQVAVINQKPSYLVAADTDTMSEFTAGVGGGGMAYPSLSIRGKEFRVRWAGQETILDGRTLEFVMVAARTAVSKRWFSGAYTPGAVEAPDCSSTDGATPDGWIVEPQSPTCAACPHNQFGSRVGPNGSLGKECGDYKRLVVLPLQDGKPAQSPVVLDLSPNSMRRTKDERGRADQRMFFGEYMQALAAHGIKNPSAVVTRVKFTSDEYPRLEFAFSRYADEALFAQVQQYRAAPETEQVLSAEAREPTGPIIPAPGPIPPPPAYATQEQPPAQAAPVEQREAPKRGRGRPARKPAQQPIQQPAAAQAAPEAPAAPAPGVMDQVRDLLADL